MSGGIVNPNIKIYNNVITAVNKSDDEDEIGGNGNIEEVIIKVKKKTATNPNGTEQTETINDGDEIRLNNYSQTYTNGEDKVRLYKYADPLSLNFKLIMDFERKSGLFASEDNHDSALAFLKRVGEIKRYDMLVHWIKVFKSLVKDFDFLFLDIDGLEIVQTKPNHEFFLDKEKIKITFRETTDMLVQSLISTYNHIVYDKVRKVSVLPSNLRKFDCYVIVFSAGYYNMIFHDSIEDDGNMDNKVLPTKRKLSDEILNINTVGNFNHTLYEFVSCSIDPESGSMFTENVSNEMSSDYVKNNLTFTYKFATSSGTFNNIMGDENWYSILAQASAENKMQNLARMQYVSNMGSLDSNDNSVDGKDIFSKENLEKLLGNTVINKKLLSNIKSFGSKETLKKMYDTVKGKTMSNIENQLINQLPSKLLGPHSVLGSTLEKLNPDYVTNMIQNTVDLGIGKIQNIFDDGITTVNNLLMTNYNDNLVDVYNNVFNSYIDKNIEVLEQTPPKPYFDSNPENNYLNPNGYVRPDNPKIELKSEKFIKGVSGLSFFDIEKNRSKNVESINIYGRKGF